MPIWLIQIVVGVVISVASTLWQQASAPKQQRRTGARGTTQFGGKVPQYFLVGTVADAGKREYPRKQWGESGGVPNAYNVDVISFGDLPVTAMTRLYINGVEEPVSTTGHVTQGFPTTGDKAGYLWVEFYDGTQSTASSYLMDTFGSDPDYPWTSDMIGRGVPYITATALWAEGVWSGFPEYLAEFQGIPLYDPRKDTTAGGSGSQRWDDPSTWEFSDNNIVIIYNIERGIHYNEPGATELGPHIWGGHYSQAQLPYDEWAAAMDACDEAVTLKGGGTEKRFRGGRRIDLNERPADVIQEFLIAANARLAHDADGTVHILVGVPEEAHGSFTDADVLATEPLGSIPFPSLDEVVNGATATYREPAQAWEDKETAPYYRSDLEAQDDGRRQAQSLDLGVVFSGTQAQRILKAVVEEGRRFRRHVVALPPEYARYHPLSVLAWTSDRFGYEDKLFLVTTRTIDPWGNVVLGLQEVDPADHDWTPETDEQPLSFAPVTVNRPPPQSMTGFAVSPYTFVDNATAARRPGILLEYTGALPDVAYVAYRVRLDGESDIIATGQIEYDRTHSNAAQPIGGQWTVPDTDYEVDARFVPISSRLTKWASEDNGGDWLGVTTPDIAVRSVDLERALREYLAFTSVSIRDYRDELERIALKMAEQDLVNVVDKKEVRQELSAAVGSVTAEYRQLVQAVATDLASAVVSLEQLQAAIGDDFSDAFTSLTAQINGSGGLAEALTAVESSYDDVSAGALFRMRAVTAPGGVDARFAIQIRETVNDSFKTVGIYADIINGVGHLALDADVTIISGSGGSFVFDGTTGNWSFGA